MSLNKFTGFTFNHMDQEDTPDLTPEQVKAAFDSRGVDLKTFLDALIDVLNSTTKGASGADNIAATAITNLDGATVQALLESLRNKLKATTDSASGADFVGATGITGLTGGTVQALLEALKTYIDTHKSSADHDSRYYTETEINAKVDMIKGSIASIDGVDSAKGNIDLVGGTGITISPDNVNKRIAIAATGESAPAAHADSHITGDDVIIGTIDQSVAPSGPAIASELLVLLNNLANRIKTVSGETNWSDAPGKNLKILANDVTAHLEEDVHLPTGLISMWCGAVDTVPSGWGLCNGLEYDRSDGTGKIATPDLRDRFIVGAGGDYNVGDTGGEESITLSSSQIPSHRHASGTLDISSGGDHSHSGSSASAGSHSHTEGTLKINPAGSHMHTEGTLKINPAGSHIHGSGTLSTNTTGSHSHSYNGPATGSFDDTDNSIGTIKSTSQTTGTSGSHSHIISGSTESGGTHSHSISGSTASGGPHSHSITGSTASNGSHSHTITIGTAGSHSHTVSGYTDYIGSGDSHENRPPYFALAFIMKL